MYFAVAMEVYRYDSLFSLVKSSPWSGRETHTHAYGRARIHTLLMVHKGSEALCFMLYVSNQVENIYKMIAGYMHLSIN